MSQHEASGRGSGCFTGFAKLVLVLLIAGGIAFFLMIAVLASAAGRFGDLPKPGPHLVLLRVEGPIYDAAPLLAAIGKIRRDRDCKGVLLRVDSPGGAVGASQELLSALKGLRLSGKPLAVSFGNVAASGGYYVALAGEKLFANPGTLTGSIGVILQFPEIERLMEKTGVSLQTVKSGELKDVGNPARKASRRELEYLQRVIDDTHAQFAGDVAEARNLPADSVRRLADGRIFTGRQALAAGLVDTLGSLDDAKRWLAAQAGLAEDAEWVTLPRPRNRLEQFLDADAETGGLGGWVAGLRNRLSPGTFFMWP